MLTTPTDLENEYRISATFRLQEPEISVSADAKTLTEHAIREAATAAMVLFTNVINSTTLEAKDDNLPYVSLELEVFHFNDTTCNSRTYSSVCGLLVNDSDRGSGMKGKLCALKEGAVPDFIKFCFYELAVPLEA